MKTAILSSGLLKHHSNFLKAGKSIFFEILLLAAVLSFFSTTVKAQNPAAFITTWKTTSANESITIPINPDKLGYNYTVDWGDGTVSASQTSDAMHTYVNAGTYTVALTGDFPAIQFSNGSSNDANDAKLLTIEQWGTQVWQGMDKAFQGCVNLTTESDEDAPVFAPNSTLYNMFNGCTSFNSDLNDWDLSPVNQTASMFDGAGSFNGNISSWEVSNVTDMEGMFTGASVFNQDIGNWDVSGVTVMVEMLDNSGLSTENYDATLIGWAAQNVQANVSFGADGLTYCAGTQARQSLVDDYDWNIKGDSSQCEISITPDANGILYVDSAIVTPGDGSSWAKALKYLSDATKAANEDSITLKIKEIHVAKGTYYPTGLQNGTNRDSTFAISRGGLKLLGGYPTGGGTRSLSDAEETILSGNIGAAGDSTDNSSCVMTLSHVDPTADSLVVEGFTLTGGQAPPGGGGAGLTMNEVANGPGTRISNCRFSQNFSTDEGAGLYILSSSPLITNCTFSDNYSVTIGGGALIVFSSATFANCTFRGNRAANGSGLYINYASPTITNCTFSDNNNENNSGVIETRFASYPQIINCLIAGNKNSGINLWSPGNGYAKITNCTIYGNNSGIINGRDAKAVITNSIIYGNGSGTFGDPSSLIFTYSLVQGMAADPANHIPDGALNPMFVNTALGDFSLQRSSPVINKGINDSIPAWDSTDLAGNSRIYDLAGGGIVDLGAYEYQGSPPSVIHPDANGILYVDSAIVTPGDGSSWVKALKYLSDAGKAANQDSITLKIKEIHVAKGTYYPTGLQNGTNRDSTFALLRGGLKLFGAYPNGGGIRDFSANPTILSGNINSVSDSADNSYHVMVIAGINENADSLIMDGFTITGGNANIFQNEKGGGMRIQNSSPRLTNVVFSGNKAVSGGGMYNEANSSPTLTHVTFSGNKASRGGGMYNSEGSPTLINVTFSGNLAGAHGGGIFVSNSSPVLTSVTFSGNRAGGTGGGMLNSGSYPVLTDVTFSGNSASIFIGGAGGGMSNNGSSPVLTNVTFAGNQTGGSGGGMYNFESAPTLTNVIFSGNRGSNGGGMANNISSPKLTNVSLTGNSADSLGGAMFNRTESAPTLTNVIVWNNETKGKIGTASASIANFSSSSPTISYSLIANSGGSEAWNDSLGIDGGNNIDSDPQFLEPVNPGDAPATAGDLRLTNTSPAIDMGDPDTDLTIFPTDENGDPIDLDDNPRVFNGENGGIVDLGAYEYQGPVGMPCPPAGDFILYVDSAAADGGNGFSWATAFNQLQNALDLADNCDQVKQIWVGNGTYKPTKIADDGTEERDKAFVLVPNVKIYGGFAGNEPANYSLSQRDFKKNETILSGDIGTPGDNSDNCYHLVISAGDVGSALLDGFTITGGNAAGNAAKGKGGGIYTEKSSPTLFNLIFSGNEANWGGGMFNESNCSPTLTNVTFIGNKSSTGGGMYNNASSPTLFNVIFSGNESGGGGGGMHNLESSPTLFNVIFSGNSANTGGGMSNTSSSPELTNVSFTGNSAINHLGGGIYNYSASSPTLTNVIMWNNEDGDQTGTSLASIANFSSSSPTISYSLIANSGGSEAWNDSLGIDGGNNIDSDPQFLEPVNPGDAPATAGDLRLTNTSPAIDMGDPDTDLTIFPTDENGDPIDLDDNPRVFNGENGGIVDMGAYEYQGTCPDITITEQPLERAVCAGTGTSFSLEATGGTLTYQWQFSSDDGGSFTDLADDNVFSGVATPTLTISAATPETAGLYRCVIDNDCNSLESGMAALGVSLIEMTGTPPAATVNVAYNFTFSVSGGAEPYAWSIDQGELPGGLNLNGVTGELSGSPEAAGDFGFTLRAEDSFGCAKTLTVNLTVAPKAAPVITFPVLTPVSYGNPEIDPGASSSNGSPVEYTSSDENVALVTTDGMLQIVGAGTTGITASLPHDPNYGDAAPVTRELVVGPATLTVTANDDSKTYDGLAYNGGNGVQFEGFVYAQDKAVLDGELTWSGTAQGAILAGSYPIMPGGFVSENYTIGYRAGTLDIEKAPLTIAADNKTRRFGQDNPLFSFTYTGFVNGEDENALNGGPSATTTATGASTPGAYPITPTGASVENYTVSYVNGTLTVLPAERTLVFEPLPEKTYGDPDFDLGAVVTGSDEEVIYTSSDPGVAEIVNGKVRITGAGTANITATLPDNPNYGNTPVIARELLVRKAPQTIDFAQIGDVPRDTGIVSLDVAASSGLPVSLSSSDLQVAGVAAEDRLEIRRLGTSLITATQGGNENYLPAQPVSRELNVVDPQGKLVKVHMVVSPNSDGINEFLLVEGIRDYPENKMTIVNRNGVKVFQMVGYDNGNHAFRGLSNTVTNYDFLPQGTYFYLLEIRTGSGWKRETGWFVMKFSVN